MNLLNEALDDTIRTTPFNTFRGVLLAAGEESPTGIGGNCRYQLQVLSQKVGHGNIQFLQSIASPHFAGIAESKEGLLLVDPTTLMLQPINLAPVLNGSKTHVQGSAFPLVKGKASRLIVMKKPDGNSDNQITVFKERSNGNSYEPETRWEYDLSTLQTELPPETDLHQMTMRQGTIALSILMPDSSLYQLKQKAGEPKKTAAKIGGKRQYVRYHEDDRDSPFGEIVRAISTRTNLRSSLVLEIMSKAAQLYPQFTQP